MLLNWLYQQITKMKYKLLSLIPIPILGIILFWWYTNETNFKIWQELFVSFYHSIIFILFAIYLVT
jgi:hypothetical protein